MIHRELPANTVTGSGNLQVFPQGSAPAIFGVAMLLIALLIAAVTKPSLSGIEVEVLPGKRERLWTQPPAFTVRPAGKGPVVEGDTLGWALSSAEVRLMDSLLQALDKAPSAWRHWPGHMALPADILALLPRSGPARSAQPHRQANTSAEKSRLESRVAQLRYAWFHEALPAEKAALLEALHEAEAALQRLQQEAERQIARSESNPAIAGDRDGQLGAELARRLQQLLSDHLVTAAQQGVLEQERGGEWVMRTIPSCRSLLKGEVPQQGRRTGGGWTLTHDRYPETGVVRTNPGAAGNMEVVWRDCRVPKAGKGWKLVAATGPAEDRLLSVWLRWGRPFQAGNRSTSVL